MIAQINSENLGLDEVKVKLNYVKEKWDKLIKRGQEIRESELLDYYECKIGNSTDKEKLLQKKLLE